MYPNMQQKAGVSAPMLRTHHALEISEISSVLDTMQPQSISFAPWAGDGPQPEASFVMAHGKDAIYLKYYIKEPTIKAEYLNINDPVFEDSCVEFFIAFDDDSQYYNLEFNCVGTCRGQYGPSKTEREFLCPSLLKTILHQTQIKGHGNEQIEWELTLSIPLTVFSYHPEISLESCRARGNFYKCGDGLPEPHYMCWSNINATYPEFHLKDFFSEISFDGRAV
jgi:hypothetical protein